MPRADIQDFDCPPGLTALRIRGNGERDQTQSGYYTPAPYASTTDRRTSPRISNQGGYAGAMTRMDEQEYGGPNRHNPNGTRTGGQPFSSLNHHHRPPSPPYNPAALPDRDPHSFRNPNTATSTLWWGDIEPWMDEEYAKQVCALMGWNPVGVNVPHPLPDPVTGQQPNNPGFCYLTFPTAAHAASVLAQINPVGSNPATMPNSTKPFVMNWASAVSTPLANTLSQGAPAAPPHQQYPKEYSIFVGDLAPETSNSDLVAVFRNPVLGLRNDREPRFIRPFLSCKSAKIMLDPVTGVSRGYGFVRFTDEADQRRALFEMPGLYCLSRPMRISPATAKYKAPHINTSLDLPQVHVPPTVAGLDQQTHPVTVALPLPNSATTKSVSNPMAATTSSSSFNSNGNGVSSSGSGSSIGASNSSTSLSSGSNTSISSSGFGSLPPDDVANLPNNVLVQIAHQYAKGEPAAIKFNSGSSIAQPFMQDAPIRQALTQRDNAAPRYTISEESWKHHAQARAILGNLIGPNGEQLTSTDPYNTTVFVGGLSPLISEETLRTFFIPFGEIHYVKVPVGKHCGFVQFVRKADAERAIEKMQGFPIGGSRIRLSWGRSQYKAAQAAAQAAQAAAMQSQLSIPGSNMMTQEQTLQILHKLNIHGFIDNIPSVLSDHARDNSPLTGSYANAVSDIIFGEGKIQHSALGAREDGSQIFGTYPSNAFSNLSENHHTQSTFSPFSPDPNTLVPETKQRESFSRSETLPHPSKAYAPGFLPLQTQDSVDNNPGTSAIAKTPPPPTRPASVTRYSSYLDGSGPFAVSRGPGRSEMAISRPPSGQMTSNGGRVEFEDQEFDVMDDLNGTLASLELDRPWRIAPGGTGIANGPMAPLRLKSERSSSPSH